MYATSVHVDPPDADGGRHFSPDSKPRAQGWRSGSRLQPAGSDGKTYKLSDFKGKKAVVLAWFPKAYTSGCTIECKSLAEHGDMIKKYNVAYFMASVDPIDQTRASRSSSTRIFRC